MGVVTSGAFFSEARGLARTATALINTNDGERKTFMFEGLFQPMHLLVLLFIALLVFGPRKLPELGKGLGDGIRGFRSAMKDEPKQPR